MKQFCVLYFLYEMVESSQKKCEHLITLLMLKKGHLKQSRNLNFDNLSSTPTMRAPIGVIMYVKTQSSAKNGSHQKRLHEALLVCAYLIVQ